MILQRLRNFPLSRDAVVCQLDVESLKATLCDFQHYVVKAQDGSYWIVGATGAIEGKAVKDTRLPDGRALEITGVFVRPGNITCWGMSSLKKLPPNYVRI